MIVTMCIPHRPRIIPRHLKEAKRQAKLLCIGFEDTLECKNAWLRAKEMEDMYIEQCKLDELRKNEH